MTIKTWILNYLKEKFPSNTFDIIAMNRDDYYINSLIINGKLVNITWTLSWPLDQEELKEYHSELDHLDPYVLENIIVI